MYDMSFLTSQMKCLGRGKSGCFLLRFFEVKCLKKMYEHRLTHASYFSVEVNNVLSFSLNIFEEMDQCQKVEMMYSKCDNYFISHLLSFSSVMSSCAKVTPQLEKCPPSLKHLIPTLQHCRISFCTRTSWFCSTLYPVAPISVSFLCGQKM